MSSAPWDYIAKLVCIGDSGCGKSSLTIRLCEGRFVAHHDVTIGVEFGSRIVPVGPPHSSDAPRPLAPSSPLSEDDTTVNTSSTPTATLAATNGGLPKPRTISPPAAALPPQKHMKLSLWDTAGQETYKSVTRSYFRGASGALLVFDLSRRQTFQHVTDWLNDLRQIAEPDIVVVLVGNKADLAQSDSDPDSSNPLDDVTPRNPAEKPAAAAAAAKNKREVTKLEAEEWARQNGVLEYVETSAKSGENVEKAFMRVAERIYQNIQAGKYDLNDRRSGVKAPTHLNGANGGGRQVRLAGGPAKTSGGACC
ncbi:GTP-binding protein rab2 [Podospora appendiculata]|uniref:GTP-binding protein rab2 n=1 Tax=Podospora appendiculata TaxID=314037 RepID=A0AAE0X2L6_9PEZI|nr:GTP-binding protein rab2 [Podospora appendiculata]